MGVSDNCQSKMSQVDKVCMVCGDKALGYNFNAVTCESCKAFFRRNALSSKDFSCPFNDTCEITVVTRRFCQRCRLEKCFKIGMRKEYIMTEEDKLLKKKKIEQNRAKRKSKLSCSDCDDVESLTKVKKEPDEPFNEYWNSNDTVLDINYTDTSPNSSHSHYSNNSPPHYQPAIITTPTMSPASPSLAQFPSQMFQQSPIPAHYPTTSFNEQQISASANMIDGQQTMLSTANNFNSTNFQSTSRLAHPNKDSSANDIVNFIVSHPEESSLFINTLMPNQKIAMEVVTKIIHSQKDAMRMIGHLIGTPGDALKIISKIMNSPYDALTVFTKFMGSPNDALEIIAKCVNSPADVLQFIQQLMSAPEDAVEIVNKFMNSPAEAMEMLNDMVNTSLVDSTTKCENGELTNFGTVASVPSTECKVSETSSSDNFGKHNTDPLVKNVLETIHDEALNSFINGYKTTLQSEKSVKGLGEEQGARSNTLESIISDAINIEYNVNNKEPNVNRELNDSETAKLNELIVAYKALFIPLDEDITPLVTNRKENSNKTEKNPQDPQLLTLINLTAIAIKRLIKMVKKINAFKNMCQEDQVALLKGGCTEMMILRSIMQYDVVHSIWNIPHRQEVMSSIKSDVLKLASNNVYEEYEKFIRMFDARLRKDENIILIMSAIVLFTPTRPKTVHTDVLILEQNSYYYLLRRYLESIYPGCEAKSLFLQLIQKINELQCLKEVIIAVYLDVNPNQVEPLLREIFDIKNC